MKTKLACGFYVSTIDQGDKAFDETERYETMLFNESDPGHAFLCYRSGSRWEALKFHTLIVQQLSNSSSVEDILEQHFDNLLGH